MSTNLCMMRYKEDVERLLNVKFKHCKWVYAVTIIPIKPAVSKGGSNRESFLDRIWKRIDDEVKQYHVALVKEYHEDGWAHYHGIWSCKKEVDWEKVNKLSSNRLGRKMAVCKIHAVNLWTRS